MPAALFADVDWERFVGVAGAVLGLAGTILGLYAMFSRTRLSNRAAEVKLTAEEQAAAMAMRQQSETLRQQGEKINRDEVIQHFHGLYEERKKRHKEDVDRLEREIGRLRSGLDQLREEKDEEIRDLRDREYRCRVEMAEVKQVLRNHGIKFGRHGEDESDDEIPALPGG